MIRRAEHQGIAAIVVTVDSPVYGQAIFINKNMFVLPRGLRFANLEASWPGRSFTFDPSKEGSIGHLLSSSVTWEDFRWLRSITTLPLVAKGILTAESALAAYENGASAVVVSNHGGRLLDGNRATIEVLPEVVAAVGDRMEIYLDGGVRSGADAVKAVSFGARAVFVGRPALWGLAYNYLRKSHESLARCRHVRNELELPQLFLPNSHCVGSVESTGNEKITHICGIST
ncbi:hypothetical protein HPB52_007813 [Rhipicephalus sanguineus]|uniref:FMN hydroxy acid dehydrogenase domain-containing protein n=1 Tax=Rhipicephalus sanguineus TaxID=34632 RepID=A0A9D4PHZ6_RHISA|nr:hypothetical protein HPB52_007813 [Rhipicephalus sanguineus]